MKPFLWLIISSLALCACSWLNNKDDEHTALCNELKSKIVFSGATSDSRKADIQNAEESLVMKTYNKECI